ncbi:dual specificity protein phosphatase family protein [Nocardioides allogilvus]|uniref:dual specificity protein phosphatase family protein n=1 Tax=Nocardioides allogilvus TaxID=2072017 RepID=UPI0013008DC4|nr:dual specificity protein phosphatase [Nocardioides allogilvus]
MQLHELDDIGITDIVDVRLEWNDEEWVMAAKPHLRYHWLGVDDAGQAMPHEWFDEGTERIRAALSDNGSVLVHCHMGINRGPSMGFAAMLSLGWDPIKALDRIREARPIAYIGYAEDALDWWLVKNDFSVVDLNRAQGRIRQWRRDNYLDVAHVIRKVRLGEGA